MAERSEVKLESQQGIESLVGRDQRKRGEGEREREKEQWWESRECFKWQASKGPKPKNGQRVDSSCRPEPDNIFKQSGNYIIIAANLLLLLTREGEIYKIPRLQISWYLLSIKSYYFIWLAETDLILLYSMQNNSFNLYFYFFLRPIIMFKSSNKTLLTTSLFFLSLSLFFLI